MVNGGWWYCLVPTHHQTIPHCTSHYCCFYLHRLYYYDYFIFSLPLFHFFSDSSPCSRCWLAFLSKLSSLLFFRLLMFWIWRKSSLMTNLTDNLFKLRAIAVFIHEKNSGDLIELILFLLRWIGLFSVLPSMIFRILCLSCFPFCIFGSFLFVIFTDWISLKSKSLKFFVP